MSGKVVDIESRKPHVAGLLVCGNCEHEWAGVVPAGLRLVECPQCGIHQGRHKNPIYPSEPIFVCLKCEGGDGDLAGGTLFSVQPAGITCAFCGWFFRWDNIHGD